MILIVGSNRDDVLYFQSSLKDVKEEIILNKYRAFTGTIFNQNIIVLQDVYTSKRAKQSAIGNGLEQKKP